MKKSVVIGLLLLAGLLSFIWGSDTNRCGFISGFSASYLSAETTSALSASFNFTVTLTTSKGTIVIGLFDDMPITTTNFKNLTQFRYYDGTIFHRVVHNFVIQGGDLSGKGIVVPTIPDELPNKHSNVRGSVAMAKASQPNSATSQFYINLVNNAYLDTNYSVFGQVVQGMDVVDTIGNVQTDTNDRPLQDVTVQTARLYPRGPPVASFVWVPSQPSVNKTVAFDARNSYGSDGQIGNYLWDFGDGSAANETSPITNHTYTFPRVYNVTLIVIDNKGLGDIVTESINVTKISSTISIMSNLSEPILRQNITIQGSITPIRPEVNVTIQYRRSSSYTWAILANVTTDEDGNYSYDWTPAQVGTYILHASWTGDVYTSSSESSLSVTCMGIPTSISILTICTSSLNGFRVEVNGRLLELYGTSLGNKTIVFSYTFAGIGIWTPIASVTTDDSGDYRLVWFPPATGYFMLKAEWAGNSTYLATNKAIAVSTISYENQYVFAVESNSTVSDLTFDSADNRLSFIVDGESGTTGYTKMTIPKTLAPDITKLKVYVDTVEYDYRVTEMTDSWILIFTYNHSIHQVEVSFNQPPIPEFPLSLSLQLFMATTLIVAVICRRKKGSSRYAHA